jgi:hypothetical protein
MLKTLHPVELHRVHLKTKNTNCSHTSNSKAKWRLKILHSVRNMSVSIISENGTDLAVAVDSLAQ